MPDVEIHPVAVLAAAVAAFCLGALWYSPLLFARLWMRAHSYTDEVLAEIKKDAPKAYFLAFVCYLVMALVLSAILSYARVDSMVEGAWLGFLCWAGFVATTGMVGNLFSAKPFSAFLIDSGYQLAYLLAMGAILAFWR